MERNEADRLVSESVQDVTEDHRLDDLNKKHVPQLWRLQVQGQQASLVHWGTPFLLRASLGLPWWVHRGRRSHVLSSFCKCMNYFTRTLCSWPNLTPMTSPNLHLQIPSHQGLGFQHVNLGECKHSVHNSWEICIPGRENTVCAKFRRL